MTMELKFSVVQYFTNGMHERVRNRVSAEEAIQALSHYTNNVAIRMGLTTTIVLLGGDDKPLVTWRAP